MEVFQNIVVRCYSLATLILYGTSKEDDIVHKEVKASNGGHAIANTLCSMHLLEVCDANNNRD